MPPLRRGGRHQTPFIGAMILCALLSIGLWESLGQLLGTARAQTGAKLPDSAEQRKQTIDAIEAGNAKLDAILKVLQDGQIKVVVVESDKKDPNAPGASPRK